MDKVLKDFQRPACRALPVPGETDFTRVHAAAGRQIDKGAAAQFFLNKILYQTGDAQAGFGEFYQKIHSRDFYHIFRMDVVLFQIVIDKSAGGIAAVEKQKC